MQGSPNGSVPGQREWTLHHLKIGTKAKNATATGWVKDFMERSIQDTGVAVGLSCLLFEVSLEVCII